jgi:hypothetical protein
MLRRALKALFILAALCVAFFGGALTAVRSHWGSPIATIHVRNESAREFQSVSVVYTTCNSTRRLVFNAAEQPASKTSERDVWMKVVLCGEGSHTTEVIFTNGSTLRTKGSYIEGGYEVLEQVRESGITTQFTRTLP